MAVFVNTFFEKRVTDLLDLAERVEKAFSSAGLEYRIAGGLAAYLYVEEVEPDAGRLTKDIDVIVRREDLQRILHAVEPFGLEYSQVAGADMLVQTGEPSTRRAVHLIFAGDVGRHRILQGVRVIGLAELVRMKLTSFRIKDQMHIKDLDDAGLITAEVTVTLSSALRQRLAEVRARD